MSVGHDPYFVAHVVRFHVGSQNPTRERSGSILNRHAFEALSEWKDGIASSRRVRRGRGEGGGGSLLPHVPPALLSDDVVDGEQAIKATNCSSDTLLLTVEEATSFDGKVFSCSCGGGEDVWTDALCNLQPDTWIQFGVTGRGTTDQPALLTIKGRDRFLGLGVPRSGAAPSEGRDVGRLLSSG